MDILLKILIVNFFSIIWVFLDQLLAGYREFNPIMAKSNYFVAFCWHSCYSQIMTISLPHLKVRKDNLTNILIHFKNGAKCSLFFGYGSHAVPTKLNYKNIDHEFFEKNYWLLEHNFYPTFSDSKRIQGTLDIYDLSPVNFDSFSTHEIVESEKLIDLLNNGIGFDTVEVMYTSHHNDVFRNDFYKVASEIFCIELMDKEEVDFYLNKIDGVISACPESIIDKMKKETYGCDNYFIFDEKEKLTKKSKIKKLRTKLKMELETNNIYNYEIALICYSAIKCFDKLDLSRNIFNSIMKRE